MCDVCIYHSVDNSRSTPDTITAASHASSAAAGDDIAEITSLAIDHVTVSSGVNDEIKTMTSQQETDDALYAHVGVWVCERLHMTFSIDDQ